MSSTILDSTNIDTSVFAYSSPKAHASGGKVVNLLNKTGKESLTLSTPMLLTWGAQESKDQAGNPLGKYTMSLQFPNSEYPNADGEACLNSMKALEKKVKQDAMLYSKDWFGKTITNSEVMDEKFNVMLRYPKTKGTQDIDYSRSPTLTLKIPCWGGVWKTEIYDEDGEPIYVHGKVNSHLNPLEFLKPKTHVICLMQCGGLWFVNGKVSITWNLKQAIVQKPRSSLEGTCFLKPKASDVAKLKSMEPVEDAGYVNAQVEDSDEEEEEEEEPVVELAPVPVPTPVAVPPPAPVPVLQVQADSDAEGEAEAEVTIVKKKRIVKTKVSK
jgi:hypothetical protein